MRGFKMVHVSQIKVGDVIDLDGKETTVCSKNISHDSFMGISIFGYNYKCGHELVKKYNY